MHYILAQQLNGLSTLLRVRVFELIGHPELADAGPWFVSYTDKIANFMEHYAEIMELNVWLKSTIEPNPTYDADTKRWKVRYVHCP
jgi:hypothetical protein